MMTCAKALDGMAAQLEADAERYDRDNAPVLAGHAEEIAKLLRSLAEQRRVWLSGVFSEG